MSEGRGKREGRGRRTIAAQEARLAVGMLAPALIIVLSIIIFPVAINFWISAKPVKLGDLRPPALLARRQIVLEAEATERDAGAEETGDADATDSGAVGDAAAATEDGGGSTAEGAAEASAAGTVIVARYILRNSSPAKMLSDIRLEDDIPPGYRVAGELPLGFEAREGVLRADLGDWEGGFAQTFEVRFVHDGGGAGTTDGTGATGAGDTAGAGEAVATTEAEATAALIERWKDQELRADFSAENVLTSLQFTAENYRGILTSNDFFLTLGRTIAYTFGGASGAILLGLCAALLVNQNFFGRGALRILLLFPYVAPIIAVAFTWQFLLDPLNGFINAVLRKFDIIESNISFLSQRPTAMISVILFDAWRYSPFAYLFILARLQAIPKELYESATVDGAGLVRTFWSITLPQLSGILGTIFLLRFIWTFNRFDDIFLLTGGAAGTKTLPIAVYDNAIGRNDIGRGSATAVILFCLLAVFLVLYIRFVERKVGEDA